MLTRIDYKIMRKGFKSYAYFFSKTFLSYLLISINKIHHTTLVNFFSTFNLEEL